MTTRPNPNDVRDWYCSLNSQEKQKANRYVELTADAALSKIGIKTLEKLDNYKWQLVWEMIEIYCMFYHDDPPTRFMKLKELKEFILSKES